MQKLIDGLVPFLIFCAILVRVVNWIRTNLVSPGPDPKNVGAGRPAMQHQQLQSPNRQTSNNPSSFLPEMTQQGAPRAAAATSRPRPSKQQAPARVQQSRSSKQQRGPAAKSSVRPAGIDRSPGSGVGAHVETFIGQHVKSHIGNQLAASVTADISDQVRNHLGEDKNRPSAPAAATTHGSAAAGDLLSALRSPLGVRQAILISEVLSRPKSLRRS